MKLAQIQIYACDRLVISAGPGRENSSHRHFGAIVTIAPDAPVTLMSRDAEPIVCHRPRSSRPMRGIASMRATHAP